MRSHNAKSMWDHEAHGTKPPPPNQNSQIHAVVNNYNMDREEEYYNQLTESLSKKITDLVKNQDIPINLKNLQEEINKVIQEDIPIKVTYNWAMHNYKGDN